MVYRIEWVTFDRTLKLSSNHNRKHNQSNCKILIKLIYIQDNMYSKRWRLMISNLIVQTSHFTKDMTTIQSHGKRWMWINTNANLRYVWQYLTTLLIVPLRQTEIRPSFFEETTREIGMRIDFWGSSSNRSLDLV